MVGRVGGGGNQIYRWSCNSLACIEMNMQAAGQIQCLDSGCAQPMIYTFNSNTVPGYGWIAVGGGGG